MKKYKTEKYPINELAVELFPETEWNNPLDLPVYICSKCSKTFPRNKLRRQEGKWKCPEDYDRKR